MSGGSSIGDAWATSLYTFCGPKVYGHQLWHQPLQIISGWKLKVLQFIYFILFPYITSILYCISLEFNCAYYFISYVFLYILHCLNLIYFRPYYTIFCFSISFCCLNYTWLSSFYSTFFLINLRSMLYHDINISYLIVFHLAVLYLTLLIRPLFYFILLNFIFPLFYLIILYCSLFYSFKLFHSILL